MSVVNNACVAVSVAVLPAVAVDVLCTYMALPVSPSAKTTLTRPLPAVVASGATNATAGFELVTSTVTPPWLLPPRLIVQRFCRFIPRRSPALQLKLIAGCDTATDTKASGKLASNPGAVALTVVAPPLRGSNAAPPAATLVAVRLVFAAICTVTEAPLALDVHR